jgi:hypothetical protein
MAFGKRTAGQAPPPYTPPVQDPEFTPDVGAVRTRVTNPGAIDRKFIGIAAGVVVLSAGAAIAAPSLMSIVGVNSVRPIEQVIAGLDRNEMRAALALEAFPDESGRAFMTSLATHFPNQHGRLLDQLADAAAAGGDRDALFAATNAWSMSFAPEQLQALSRTGAEGFDKALGVVSDALKIIESEAGGCSMKTLERYLRDPSTMVELTRYGGEGYRMGMRAGATMIELAAKGRNAPPVNTTITPDDEIALRSTFISLLSDPQVMNLIQSGMAGSQNLQADMAQTLNVCQLARTVIVKLEDLPSGTKTRLMGTALSGDLGMMPGGFGNPFGPDGFQGGQPTFGATQFFP